MVKVLIQRPSAFYDAKHRWKLAGLLLGVVSAIAVLLERNSMDSVYSISSEPFGLPQDSNVVQDEGIAVVTNAGREKRGRTVASTNNTATKLLNPALYDANVGAGRLWAGLLMEAQRIKKSGGDPGIVVEVGMYNADQCLGAAILGLEAHCVEPSPPNMERVRGQVAEQPQDIQDRVHLYQAAAGGGDGIVPFTSAGGTGDHIGTANMWTMETNNAQEADQVVEVPSKKLDDIISVSSSSVWALKIDTQGYEPIVFSGMQETLKSQTAKFILVEYWPKGMDLITGKLGDCRAVDLLQQLLQAGYRLYVLRVEAHPRAPREFEKLVHDRPLDDLHKNCQWYYDMEQRVPSNEYKMGYWSDILAVAPSVKFHQTATYVGKVLRDSL